MSTQPHPRLEGPTQTPTGPSSAEPAPAADGSGALKVVAEGVLSSLRPDPRGDDGRRPVGWLHIVAPPSFSAPVRASSWCSCGYERTAIGRPAVLQLVQAHDDHRTACPRLTTTHEGRAAA
ncbi:hypothetical protein [Streptomyces sp. NBC_01233]|uniref:hypothetical protein n=1 Tax=Streptomyces sp. NBC_01233 TaxID=2903787 RepID=UPI002E12834F|nr:hypothetical protein OG332_17935 [Streptomyces sp. NBC_01233]